MTRLPDKITFHWTAVDKDIIFKEYHYNIKKDGTVVQTLSILERGAHTYLRNTGNIGIAACGGPKLTSIQLEKMAALAAELIWRCKIKLEDVKDHVYYSNLDDYGIHSKIDIGGTKDDYYNKVMKKIDWYLAKMKKLNEKGELKFEFSMH